METLLLGVQQRRKKKNVGQLGLHIQHRLKEVSTS